MQEIIITFDNLQDAKEQIQCAAPNTNIILVNSPFALHSLGMITIDYILQKLKATNPQITNCFINYDNDVAARVTAQKMGYKFWHKTSTLN